MRDTDDPEQKSGGTQPEVVYVCMDCGHTMIVPQRLNQFPACPVCGETMWLKV